MPDQFTDTIDSALRSLSRDGELSLPISGGCMQPHIMDGARVRVENKRFYLPGDILVIRGRNGELFSHRLIGFYPRRRQLGFVCQADRAQVADPTVSRAQLIGRVCGGECTPSAVKIPFRDRLRAYRRFAGWLIRRIRVLAFESDKVADR